jgi:hypothetical protein
VVVAQYNDRRMARLSFESKTRIRRHVDRAGSVAARLIVWRLGRAVVPQDTGIIPAADGLLPFMA